MKPALFRSVPLKGNREGEFEERVWEETCVAVVVYFSNMKQTLTYVLREKSQDRE